jgi:hypothetical protein
MIRKVFLPILLLAGCGQPAQEESASLALNVRIAEPTVFPLAEKTVEQQLQEIVPVKLRIMVCDEVKLSAQVKVFCSAEKEDYNYIDTIELDPAGGSAVLYDVPSAFNQVIVAQGLDAGDSVTYQGFATQAVIAPRGRYSVDVNLAQIKFPELPPPPAPVLTNTSFEVPKASNAFTFKGTREAGTVLKAILPAAFNLGTSPTFSGNTSNYYKESTSGDTTTWELSVFVPARTPSQPRSYPVKFAASRVGTDKFGKEAVVTLQACADDGGGGQVCN